MLLWRYASLSKRCKALVDEQLCPGQVIDVEQHGLGDDAGHGLLDAVVVAGCDLGFEPLLLLARKSYRYRCPIPVGSATQSASARPCTDARRT